MIALPEGRQTLEGVPSAKWSSRTHFETGMGILATPTADYATSRMDEGRVAPQSECSPPNWDNPLLT